MAPICLIMKVVARQSGILNLPFHFPGVCLVWHTRPMNPQPVTNLYKRYRLPAEIISHWVWLYFRFCLSYRDVEELMTERGLLLTYETVRYWCRKFGQAYAHQLQRRRPRPGGKWHLDEVFLTIHGERFQLWRAVDQDGNVLDILVQRRRNKKAGHTVDRNAPSSRPLPTVRR
jgi:DDE domain